MMVTSAIYFVYLGDYYRVSNTVRLLQFKFAPPSMGNNQMGSLFDTPPYHYNVNYLVEIETKD